MARLEGFTKQALARAVRRLVARAESAEESRDASTWLLRELLVRCTDAEWRAKIEARIAANTGSTSHAD